METFTAHSVDLFCEIRVICGKIFLTGIIVRFSLQSYLLLAESLPGESMSREVLSISGNFFPVKISSDSKTAR